MTLLITAITMATVTGCAALSFVERETAAELTRINEEHNAPQFASLD